MTYRNGEVSHWLAGTRATRKSWTPGTGPSEVDVAIVGGGLTGLWTAYYLQEHRPELSVAVLEAEHVGYGASGRNGGWASHLIPGNRARYARGPRGAAGARDFQSAMFEGIDEILAVCGREGIEADQARGGNLVLATTPAAASRLAARRDGDLRYGLTEDQVVWLDRAQARERVNAEHVSGGMYYPAVVRVHPGKLVTGLAAAVERRGAAIFEQSRVRTVGPGGVRLEPGTLRAGRVLVCTEGYGIPLLGARSMIPVNSSMIVTEPLSEKDWDAIGWRAAECVSDAAHTFVYSQRTADGRIAIGGRGAPYRFNSGTGGAGVTAEKTVRQLEDRLHRYFPRADIRVAHAWSGVLGVTRDWCARVTYDRETRVGSSGGYAGHGVTATNVGARTLVDLTLGRDTELARLPWVGYRSPRWEPEPLRWLGVHGMYELFRIADQREEKRGLAKTSWIARVGSRLAGLHE
ncbi:FAD-dependent oxidoreductase [Amycolatopsis acidicola]|uniref:FAD-dependent oxidoreductase n=1 Tax=Amycolatopsis acidicola TaxID=2596893 RepID=A0A5N0UXY7_9PSEU|nr:FAD-dependent oxidoreductase [Amycolatopsis acidicola]KAA9157470.1 FAD-dependent oxidoreductase [Amycolatopsis acidicola]